MNEELMKKRATEIKNKIMEAYNNSHLDSFIFEEQVEIRKNSNGNLSRIIFQVSTPYIYLDFDGEYKGRIVALGYPPQLEVSPIPLETWWEIEPILEEIIEEYFID